MATAKKAYRPRLARGVKGPRGPRWARARELTEELSFLLKLCERLDDTTPVARISQAERNRVLSIRKLVTTLRGLVS
jgi:uncharacterized membrane-anchored protein